MKKYIRHLCIKILQLIYIFPFIISCEFQPGEIPDSHVEKPSQTPPAITLDITPETEVLWVNESVVIRYHANVMPRKLQKVVFAVDGTLVYDQAWNMEGTLEMMLDISPYADGMHTLTITFYTNSNSGSIADKTGNEGYQYTLEWPLLIDRDPGHALSLQVSPVDEGVRLLWEEFNHPAFKNYTITKHSDSFIESKTLAIITDPLATDFIDTTYLEGEKASYTIGLNAPYGTSKTYSELPEPPIIEQTGPFSINVSWRKTRNPKILDYYFIYNQNNSSVPSKNLVVREADSTSKTLDNIYFGTTYKFILQYIPKNYTYGVPSSWIDGAEKSFTPGEPMDAHEVSRSIPGTNDIFLIKGSQVNKYNMETGQSTPFLSVHFDNSWVVNVSPDGSHYGYSSYNEFIVRNSSTNEILYTLSDTVYDAYRLTMYTLSSNNRVLLAYEDGKMIIFDLTTRKQVAKTNFGSFVYAKISPDGNHVIARDYNYNTTQIYYEIADTSFVEISRIQDGSALQRYATFSPDNRLYLFYTGRVEIRNVQDFSIINQYELPTGYTEAWDFDSNQLLATDYSNKRAYVMDINSGGNKKMVLLGSDGFNNLKNNYLTSGIGRKLKLDFTFDQQSAGYHEQKSVRLPLPEKMLK
jgi:hypothetical protein